jgi:hypothetical protein
VVPVVAGALALGYALLPQLVRLGQDVTPQVPVDAGLLVPEYGEAGTHLLHYRHGRTVTVRVPVRNSGMLPITVRAVAPPDHDRPLLEPDPAAGLPVTLGPGERATVTLPLRFANCRYYHERSMETLDRVLVSGSALGREFTEPVALARPLAVHGQVILDCPDRTLVRGDDVRDG